MQALVVVIIILVLGVFLLFTIGKYIELNKFDKENFDLYKSDFIDKMEKEENNLYKERKDRIEKKIEHLKREYEEEEHAAAIKKDIIKENLELAEKNNKE